MSERILQEQLDPFDEHMVGTYGTRKPVGHRDVCPVSSVAGEHRERETISRATIAANHVRLFIVCG
ncbi:hypothetical protein HNR46_004110 [Haloferula luteola]|uniref:Uncharacterized protein n=1 Tax=Haloferula luteola TaxID=595692 RepID=A0A840V9T8_9BACT|nr:hypothetical protein [Haloferula luteola]MBB5353846.1 hypothetical protein [Haloferula luteola]